MSALFFCLIRWRTKLAIVWFGRNLFVKNVKVVASIVLKEL